MTFQKNDFIELEFTGKIKDTGEIFDSNIKEDLENTNSKQPAKPLVFPIGQDMFLKGIDKFLIGKDKGEYELELSPEESFGKRDPKSIQLMPLKIFIQHKINPVPGVVFNFDGKLAKILSVSGGRVMVDFNNLIAGKTVIYKLKVLKKVEDLNEKIKAMNDFLFRKDFQFELKENKLILQVEKQMEQFVQMFKEQFKEILNLDLETKTIENEKSVNKTSKGN